MALGSSTRFRRTILAGNILSDTRFEQFSEHARSGFHCELKDPVRLPTRPGALLSPILLQISNSSSVVTGGIPDTFRDLWKISAPLSPGNYSGIAYGAIQLFMD